MAITDTDIALNRFGLGARPDEKPPGEPRRWLSDQFARYDASPAALSAVPSRATIAGEMADYFDAIRGPDGLRAQRKQQLGAAQPMAPEMSMPAQMTTPEAMMPTPPGAIRRPGPAANVNIDPNDPLAQTRRLFGQQNRGSYATSVGARVQVALTSPAPFVERLVHFWANHFAVSADKQTVIGLAGLLEFEAIRPHVLGTFGDMLNAVERHPAMLLYLDQAQSIGPASPIGARIAERGQRKVGLNENLAREIMELHTLGVRTGYSQADVTEFARALTGWTVAGISRGPGARFVQDAPGDFAFVPPIHEPGTRTIVGKSYSQDGERQAAAVLADLAVHPATAHHVSTKLARHFAGDEPPPALVERMAAAFLKSGGDLPSVYRVLIDAPETWVAAPVKFKTPWEWSLSTMRALGQTQAQPLAVTALMQQLGQPVWRPGAPAGYDDIAASWAGPDALIRRAEAAERFAARVSTPVDARALASALFPASLSPATAQAIARAESPGQALALLLVAPESLRR